MADRTGGFTIVRDFAADRRALWSSWTDPDVAARWWHPRGVSTPRESVAIDLRIGGAYGYTMVLDQTGALFPTAGWYLEVIEEERLVFTWAAPGEAEERSPLVAMTLDPLSGTGGSEGTRMTFHLAGIEGGPGDGNVYDGWVGAFAVLDEVLADRPATSSPPT